MWHSPSLQAKKTKEWLCTQPHCDASNYAERSACYKCNYPRHGLTLPLKKSKLGDWYCLENECYTHNFGFRQQCYRCKAKRAEEIQTLPSLVMYNLKKTFI